MSFLCLGVLLPINALSDIPYPDALDVVAEKPVSQALWSFDSLEQLGVADSPGHPFNFVDGVKGKALVFDGYNTELVCEPQKLPLPGENFTISAWVAPQEYSWNLSAVINQQKDFERGYFFGINHAGQLVGSLAVEGGWTNCVSEKALPLLKWSFVAMVFESGKGIRLYIDGAPAGEVGVQGKPVFAADEATSIGKTRVQMTPANTERDTSRAVRSWMYFDGLIDELDLCDASLTEAEIRNAFKQVTVANIQPLQYRKMPSGSDEPRSFGAYYTCLKYAPGWDALWRGSDFPDIVVRFAGSPVKLVFWRGTGYIPAMVTENGIWMTDQSVEFFGTGECYETMGDKQCRYSHVRIIENTPARAVIHWRYALSSISHRIWAETETRSGDWVDEYWTAWPDGVVVRKQVLWSEFRNPGGYQFQETIFFNQPGVRPQDNVEYEAITFMDMAGNKASYSWEQGAPKKFEGPEFKPIEMVNMKSKYKPFSIHHSERVTGPFRFGWIKGYSTFPCWNHWPVSQIPSDGRKAVAPDKPSHSSLTAVNGNRQKLERCEDGSVRVRSMMGMTTNTIESLLPLARSWNKPPEVNNPSAGYDYAGYDQYQRAYLFRKQKGSNQPLEFELSGTESSPIVNIPIVIKNWGLSSAAVEINGEKAAAGGGYSVGNVSAADGDDLIIWIPLKSVSLVKIKVRGI